MPIPEERLTTLEKTVALLQKSSSTSTQELSRNLTMLLGIVSSQQLDIKEIKISQVTVEERLDMMDRRMESGFETLEKRLGAMESGFGALEKRLGAMESGFGALEKRLGAMESGFGALEKRLGAMESGFGALNKKIDQMVGLLTTFAARPERNTE